MTADPMNSFRQRLGRPLADQAAGGAAVDADDEYRAWGKSHPESRCDRLDLRLIPSAAEIDEEGDEVVLHYLMRVTYTHSKRYGDQVTLCFADQLVTLEGSNLRDFRRDLRAGKVDFVQVYDARRWPAQTEGKAVVTGIRMEKPGAESRPAMRLAAG